jgi:hypothetical protein
MSSRVLALVLAIALGGLSACSSAPGAPSAAAGATSYTEFHEAFCAAFVDMFRAIGNPDAGTDSELITRLEQAIAADDAAAVEKVAAEITAALESGREHARVALAWPPASPAAAPVDQLFVAFEKSVDARRAAAPKGVPASQQAGQAAFEQAGGLDSWNAMLKALQEPATMAAIASARPSGADPQCPTVPIHI